MKTDAFPKIDNSWWVQHRVAIAAIYLCSVGFLLLLIANPGYFSHDEYQRYDYFLEFGFVRYLLDHLHLNASGGLSAPLRPFPFLIQGLQNFFFRDYPVLVHLSAVFVTATVAALFYVVLIRFAVTARVALTAALIFVFNPLSILATGWSAALMDQWYVLFILSGLLVTQSYLHHRSTSHLVLILICVVLALMSKETALMAPAVLGIFLLRDPGRATQRAFWNAAGVWLLPVVTYFVYRVLGSHAAAGTPSAPGYAMDLRFVAHNLFSYFLFPFHWPIADVGAWQSSRIVWSLLALSLHLTLLWTIARTTSRKILGAYLLAYFAFLSPVLWIRNLASHYLYATALVHSLAMAIWIQSHSKPVRRTGQFALLLLIVHSAIAQRRIYDDGVCMSRISVSLESIYLSNRRPMAIEISPATGANTEVLNRYTLARHFVGPYYPVQMQIRTSNNQLNPDAVQASMNAQCIISSK